jgi:hypothetical protein
MLKKTILYEGFDGINYSEDFYFNLTKAELVELEVSVSGGLSELLKQIAESENDGQKIIDHFKKIILMSVGKKSNDGKRFIKNDTIREEFEQSNAYSELFIELATSAEEAGKFIRGIVPADLVSDMDKSEQAPKTTVEVVELPQEPLFEDLTDEERLLIQQLRHGANL